MKYKFTSFTLLISALFIALSVQAQEKKASPAQSTSASINGNDITIKYSSPRKKGRTIYGKLVPFGKVWRTGANDATTFSLSKDATVGGQSVKAGTYALFTIPNKDSWTIILNSKSDQWGAYSYDESKNVATFDVSPETIKTSEENFTISIDNAGTASLIWDTTKVSFTIK